MPPKDADKALPHPHPQQCWQGVTAIQGLLEREQHRVLAHTWRRRGLRGRRRDWDWQSTVARIAKSLVMRCGRDGSQFERHMCRSHKTVCCSFLWVGRQLPSIRQGTCRYSVLYLVWTMEAPGRDGASKHTHRCGGSETCFGMTTKAEFLLGKERTLSQSPPLHS